MTDAPPPPPVDPEKIARQRHFAIGLFQFVIVPRLMLALFKRTKP